MLIMATCQSPAARKEDGVFWSAANGSCLLKVTETQCSPNRKRTLSSVSSPGEYHYKFVIDGEWHPDASAATQIPNDFGTTNSVIRV